MKNVVMLAMSTLGTRNAELNGSYFTYDGCSEQRGLLYFSQLEPISRMIREREGSLDYVVILATKETMEKEPREEGVLEPHIDESDLTKDSCYGLSAVDYYRKRIEADKYGTQIDVVPLDPENMVPAINEAVSDVRKYWKTEEDSDKRLWIDTQGAQREVNLVLNAVVSLLGSSGEGIVPYGRYSIAYDRANVKKNIPHPIKDQTETYQVFDFVSGINELTAYGRADQLSSYYEKRKEKIPEIVETMRKIAESIQLCDMESFDRQLKLLRKQWRNRNGEDSLLSIFAEQIEEDYKTLLNQSCTKLDIIEWLCKKKFYQQTLTYIESRMPRDWKERRIWDYKGCEPGEIESLKERHETVENFLILSVLRECYPGKSEPLAAMKEITVENIRKKGRTMQSRRIVANAGELTVKNKNRSKEEKIRFIVNISNKDQFIDALFLYKLLKEERNRFNHMGENEKRASENQIKDAVSLFVSLGRELQSCEVKNTGSNKNSGDIRKQSGSKQQGSVVKKHGSLFPVNAFENIKL